MQTKDYTPDAVCRSLGLPGFDEGWSRGKPPRRLRLLLCPSFAPEVCVTLEDARPGVSIRVDASRTQIWALASLGLVTVDRDFETNSQREFDQVAAKFRAAVVEPVKAVVVLEGMRVHAYLCEYGRTLTVSDNPGKDAALGKFIAELVKEVYDAIRNPGCRNGLAEAGHYVGLELPVSPAPELPAVTQMAVLGTPEDQGEVLAALAGIAGKRPRTVS